MYTVVRHLTKLSELINELKSEVLKSGETSNLVDAYFEHAGYVMCPLG